MDESECAGCDSSGRCTYQCDLRQQQASAGEVPEWAWKRAYELAYDHQKDRFDTWQSASYRMSRTARAFARYIAAHEPEPLDPLEQAVKEASDVCAFKPNYAACMAAELRARGVTVAKRD